MITPLKQLNSSQRLNAERQELIIQAKRFNPQALAEIYDAFSPGIYRYALHLLGDQELARECMSDTFQRFLTALQRGGGPDDYLRAYLYRIAHNWITDHYRSKQPVEVELDEDLRSEASQEPAHTVAQELERQQVRDALALLTPEQRQVVVLKYLEEWSNEEIARSLNKPVGAVKALQHRALGSLRRLLLKDEEND